MTRARLGALAVPVIALAILAVPGGAQEPVPEHGVLVVLVPEVSLEDLMAFPEMQALAAAGGAGVRPGPSTLEGILTEGFRTGVVPLPTSMLDNRLMIVKQDRPAAPLARLGREIRRKAEQFTVERLLVVVAGTSRSAEMEAANDELLPIVLGWGEPATLFESDGEARALTSDSTRRAGVVIDGDVVPTVLAFEGGRVPGHPRPETDVGTPIRAIEEPPPFELHDRYLAQRRMYVPVGTAGALYVTGAGLLAVAITVRREGVPDRCARVVAWASLSVPMLATGLLAAGHLPDLSYATAIPMVSLVTVFGTMAFSPLERRDPTSVPAAIGLVVLAFFAVEALLGWPAMLTPLLGGSQLDGGRFYGLPNVAIGLLVGAALWVAQRTRTFTGFWLLCGVGLFAGFPLLGANLGGAVTAFAAAGLWLAVRERERLGVRVGVALSLVVVAVGTGVILSAHAISPVATHITDFEEDVKGLGGVLSTFVERLQVGFDLIAGSPAALVPVLGLPVALLVILRPPPPIRATFERWPAWRDAVLVTILAGLVAYVVNDSGPAAAGLAFGLGMGGMLGVSLLVPPGKMGTP